MHLLKKSECYSVYSLILGSVTTFNSVRNNMVEKMFHKSLGIIFIVIILSISLPQSKPQRIYNSGEECYLEERIARLEKEVASLRNENKPIDCLALYENGHTTSGVYTIYPGGGQTQVFCNMEISGGGWTVIQNRFDGSVDFNRDWTTYKNGFGTSAGEYWLVNDVIHELTKAHTSSLYVSITLTNGTTLFEQYERFSVSSEWDNYRLLIAGRAFGTLGDSMIKRRNAGDIINGMMFSTRERDNDKHMYGHCGREHSGSWWFNVCHDAYLNGVYGSSSWKQPWTPTVPLGTLIRKTMMMLKRS